MPPRTMRRRSLQDPPLVPPGEKKKRKVSVSKDKRPQKAYTRSPQSAENFKRKSVLLHPPEWNEWDRLAERHKAFAKGGPEYGETSWRTLMGMIGRGEVIIISRDDVEELRKEILEEVVKEMGDENVRSES
jgi:hypothetical protein